MLFRGFSPPNDTKTLPEVGSNVRVLQNALSSWSASGKTARSFGAVLLGMRVPASRIVTTCRTGIGSVNEFEYVIAGGGDVEDLAYVVWNDEKW